MTDQYDTIVIDRNWIDVFAPFHLCLDVNGVIVSSGRTLTKLAQSDKLLGSGFFDCFSVDKPRNTESIEALLKGAGRPISVSCQSGVKTQLRGMVIPLHNGGCLLNFSLGTRMQQTAETFGLTKKDFAPSDSTIDLIFSLSAQAQLLNDAAELTDRLRKSQEDAARKAVTDALTGLPNRRGFYESLSEREGAGAIIQIDLDHFKNINDTYGHEAGDDALVHAANIFRAEFRKDDFVARMGGDEFVALLVGEVDKSDLESTAHRIVSRVCEPLPFADNAQIGVSMGIRLVAGESPWDVEGLLADADLALYTAKRDGRGRWAFFENGMREHFQSETDTLQVIREGLAADAFVPFFQPQISVSTGKVVGIEVLARLDHPTRGVFSPGFFLDVAQRLGLLRQIDDQVRVKAFKKFSSWRAAGFSLPLISLNIHAERLSDKGFSTKLTDELTEHDLTPNDVALEILETVLFDAGPSQMSSAITSFAANGFHIHLDDFGTGHASLSSLLKLPVDKLKIDRSLISEIDRQPKLQEMARAIVDLAQHLGVATIAEGVETEEEIAALMRLGCNEIQGFRAARPMEAEDFVQWLINQPTDVGRAPHGAPHNPNVLNELQRPLQEVEV